MLRITVSKNSAAAVSYYQKGLSQQDYYLDKKHIPGKWHGKTALMLGLSGTVDKDTFEAMANNRHPKTGEKLTVRDAANRRAGVDFTFSAPKSASILYGITGDDDILRAHKSAVEAAIIEVEADMQTQMNKNGKKNYATTGNIAYASFEHFTSRPVRTDKNKPLEADPQLHSHCFIFNISYAKEKKRFQAIEQGNVHRNAEYYEALYHSKFSSEMRASGYAIERSGKWWEVKKIDRPLINKFSNRSSEIKDEIAKTEIEKGITLTVKQKAAVGALTRINKNKLKTTGNLKSVWLERLSKADREKIKSAKGNNSTSTTESKKLSPNLAIDQSIKHFLERKSVVPEKKVLARAMQLSYGIHSAEQIKTALAKRTDLIIAKKSGIDFLTTKEMLQAENRMIAFAAKGKNTVAPINPKYEIEQDFLNAQQKKAVKHILSSKDRVVILSGGAGVGKSTLLKEVKSGIESTGKQIFAFAPSAEASRKNLRDKGFETADTIQRFLIDKKLQQQTKGQIIMIDEAGMVGTRKMNEIFKIAEIQKSRVILSGDHRQHSAVNAGDALRQLEYKSGLKPARVKEVVRQRHNPEYKKAITALAHGYTEAGFKKLDQIGCIKEVADARERHDLIAEDYFKSVSAKRSAIVVSPTHAEGNKISDAIRGKLQEEKRLSSIERSFDIQRPLSFTESERKDHNVYEKGMSVQFHQNVPGFKAGEKYEVTARKDGRVSLQQTTDEQEKILDLKYAERFQVFRKDKIEIATGETIRISVNGRTRENNRINNGQVYQVTGFTEEGHIKLSNGKTLDKNYRNFQYGYTRTSFAVQGRDAQDVLIAQSAVSFPASNDKQFYVSTSRGVETCRIYTDDKEELKRAVQRPGDRPAARELAEASEKQKRQRFYSEQIKKKFRYGKDTKEPKKVISTARKFRR